ncbi:hypothetical protein [Caulobacter mirabilis]|uniref:Uncharacterized protein n=1 Tax=Caulobacter mirabilis TaxID=69666 RepID=A0A2D2AY92_9CAUL|nr:hypothetical protein [Caulobacter mirabilis]ATQ42952.1 hypothetical protein CSW64_11295 [Caulobacter mirabilis]
MKTPLLLVPGLVAAATLAGLWIALYGAGAWDLLAYALLAPLAIFTGLVSLRAARALFTRPSGADVDGRPGD